MLQITQCEQVVDTFLDTYAKKAKAVSCAGSTVRKTAAIKIPCCQTSQPCAFLINLPILFKSEIAQIPSIKAKEALNNGKSEPEFGFVGVNNNSNNILAKCGILLYIYHA
jgi:hypothetical protein